MQVVDDTSSVQADREDCSIDGIASDSESLASNRADSQREDHNPETRAVGEPSKAALSPTIVVTASTDTEDSNPENLSDEDRKHLTHFKSWGTPTARNKPSEECWLSF